MMTQYKSYENYLVDFDSSLSNAVEKMCVNKYKGLVIIHRNKVVGTFTRQDLVKCSHCFGFNEIKIGEFINKSFDYCLNKYDEKKFKDKNHTLVPIVNEKMELLDIEFLKKKKIKKIYHFPVVIMAGGKGTRLLPYTNILPKPLIPVVDDIPMVGMIINSFKKYGTNEYYMIVNYKKEMIEDYFNSVEKDYRLTFIEESNYLGTGGGLRYAKDKIDSTFFLSNCDILMLENYNEVYEYHKKNKNVITMIVSLKPINIPYGVIKTDENQCIIESIEKPTYMTLVNTGIYILEPDVFDYIKEEEHVDFPTIIERLKADNKKIGVYPITSDRWLDMGQIEELNNSRMILTKILEEEKIHDK